MGEREDEPVEHPATWENVVVGKAKKLVGEVFGDDELAEEGEEQEEIAHEVAHEVAHDAEHAEHDAGHHGAPDAAGEQPHAEE